MRPRTEPATELDLAAKVALLRRPATYPEPTTTIEAIETHMSWVFLTDRHAYKLKKPVRYDFLDFSTLAARERYCTEERRLNQPLAPGVYLDVVPLTLDDAGHAQVAGTGAVIDWLVKMRRLPSGWMLHRLIREQTLARKEVLRLARVLARFYQERPPIEMEGATYRARYAQMLHANLAVLGEPAYELPSPLVTEVHNALFALLERSPKLFDARAEGGRIVDGHGDLRPEHVCLEAVPVIFDRLEFNREFRIADAADELASLSMECERLGAAFVGTELFRVYRELTHDVPPASLLRFYMAYRACLRARLAILHTRECVPAARRYWRELASGYLRLAQQYSRVL
jgi:aminoglycoside phosphotransferase family enzyme